MTEQDAKTKWCPQVGGRPSKGYPGVTNCIASECMWWVWNDETHLTGKDRTNGGHCGAIK